MTKTLALFLCVLAVLVSPASALVEQLNLREELIRLDDVQGLFGGQTLVLVNDGSLWVRKVSQGKEKRYTLQMSDEELKALMAFILKSGIFEYREKERTGVPDEARPKITVTLEGQPMVAEKWANDKAPKFDKLYEKLLQWVERAAKKPASREQRYDSSANFP
jgi:hypothetical protein